MAHRPHPIFGFDCPDCGGHTVTWNEEEPKQLFPWEDVLFINIYARCASCEWSEVVGRIPQKSKLFRVPTI